MITKQEAEPINKAYAPLWDLMNQEHGKVLLMSEMDEIISVCNQVQDNLKKLYAEITFNPFNVQEE
jgi:hypothetical protein